MTEREKYLTFRIAHLREMLRELETEKRELERERLQHYFDRLETSCQPSRLEHFSHD